jgi:hypothetical protein
MRKKLLGLDNKGQSEKKEKLDVQFGIGFGEDIGEALMREREKK